MIVPGSDGMHVVCTIRKLSSCKLVRSSSSFKKDHICTYICWVPPHVRAWEVGEETHSCTCVFAHEDDMKGG